MLLMLAKTPLGLEFLKDRRSGLSPRQRSAFILFDGKRSTRDVLAATAAMGITADDIDSMVTQQLLEPVAGAAAASDGTTVKSSRSSTATAAADIRDRASGRSAQERYQEAYPVAIALTASLGLRGFRLNLAVEGSSGYQDLAALMPKIRDAVGAERSQALEEALFN